MGLHDRGGCGWVPGCQLPVRGVTAGVTKAGAHQMDLTETTAGTTTTMAPICTTAAACTLRVEVGKNGICRLPIECVRAHIPRVNGDNPQTRHCRIGAEVIAAD